MGTADQDVTISVAGSDVKKSCSREKLAERSGRTKQVLPLLVDAVEKVEN
jgi:hypothetical protein